MNISKGARSFDKCKVKTVNTSKRLGNVGGFVNASDISYSANLNCPRVQDLGLEVNGDY